MTLIDASVAFKWFVPEQGSLEAQRLLAENPEVVAPELILAEVGNALWKVHRRGAQSANDFDLAIRNLRASFTQLLGLDSLVERAGEMARTLNHPIYDCFYLASAEEIGGQLITADLRLLQALSASEFAPLVRALA